MNKYDSYKDSGVEWLGNIPSSWNKIKLKHKGDVIIGLSYKPDDVVNENEGTLVMRSSNVQNGKPNFDDNIYVKTEISDKLTTKEGDILICSRNGSRRLIGKNCLITKDIEGMTWGVFMTMYRSPYYKYMYWLLNSPIFKSQSGLFLTSTINQLTVSTLENMVLPFTENIDDQKQIVSFLDTKTSLIDSLIEKTQRKIELLKEKRTSLINEVVTKGLNPNVDMKDSGVEWIGEIPSHWTIPKMSYLLEGITDGTHGTHERVNEGELFLSSKNVTNKGVFIGENESKITTEEHEKIVKKGYPIKGDILITVVGSIGRSCVYEYDYPISFQRSVCFLRFKETINKYFMNFLIHSDVIQFQLLKNTKKSTQGGIYMNDLKRFDIILPSLTEQQQIVEYLDEQTGLIDKTISIEEKRIELLKEYRQSLISEVVTGKRKVVE
jgi:type I restriction enzyme S subunit